MPTSSWSDPNEPHPADAFCLNLLATKEHREARAWLAEASATSLRTIGEQSPRDSRTIVDALYRDGAVDVQAVDIDQDPRLGETTNVLVVKLPAEAELRAKLFKHEGRIARSNGFDPQGDTGQTLMFLFKFNLSLLQFVKQLFRGRG